MYSKTHFRGKAFTMNGAITKLANHAFDNIVQSINVKGCLCWKIYEFENFKGNSLVLTPGEYSSAIDIKSIFKKASSVELIDC